MSHDSGRGHQSGDLSVMAVLCAHEALASQAFAWLAASTVVLTDAVTWESPRLGIDGECPRERSLKLLSSARPQARWLKPYISVRTKRGTTLLLSDCSVSGYPC